MFLLVSTFLWAFAVRCSFELRGNRFQVGSSSIHQKIIIAVVSWLSVIFVVVIIQINLDKLLVKGKQSKYSDYRVYKKTNFYFQFKYLRTIKKTKKQWFSFSRLIVHKSSNSFFKFDIYSAYPFKLTDFLVSSYFCTSGGSWVRVIP